ncbi:protein of unknown function (plasmid) [Thermococcus nautili]|nr:hypothetical protein [Thermococcus nautili]CAI1494205.1 protein of unknown function [Thermococcus nautili]
MSEKIPKTWDEIIEEFFPPEEGWVVAKPKRVGFKNWDRRKRDSGFKHE